MAEKKTFSANVENTKNDEIVIAKEYEPEGGMNIPRFCEKELLAVMGTADPSRSMAPFEDENFEIWGCQVCVVYPDVKRLDVLFEMHTESYWKHSEVFPRLKEIKQPMYMQKEVKELPTSMRYPIEIIEQYRGYSTSTISHMLALAYHSFIMTEKPKHVALFGIAMFADEEYSEQRPCCEYWLGRMEGAGMDIEIAPGSALLASPGLYGYQNYNPIAYDLRTRLIGVEMGINHSKNELEKWKQQLWRNEGAKAEDEYWLRKIQKGEID